MVTENTIVYLIGHPGTGKTTIAHEIAKHPNFIPIDNHTFNNTVFPFVRTDGSTPMPEKIWDATKEIRRIALDIMVTIGNRDNSYISTNCLYDDDESDQAIYKSLMDAASQMDAAFVPAILTCTEQANIKRLSGEGREERMKMTDTSGLIEMRKDSLLNPDHPHQLELDVTQLTAKEAADIILQHLKSL